MTDMMPRPQMFQPSAPARRREGPRTTIIENDIQVSIRRGPPAKLQPKPDITSPMTDDFPTPRATTANRHASPARSASESDSVSDHEMDRNFISRRGASGNDYDEMYDVSGSEAEEVPLKLSMSIQKRLNKKNDRDRYPSVVIPSPGQWPTIEKMKAMTTTLSPTFRMQLSPAILSRFKDKNVPSTSSTPSLDGSLTSEELNATSCPSTPALSAQAEDQEWDAPLQLDPSSITLLQQINGEVGDQPVETVIEVPQEPMEMREVVDSPPFAGHFKLDTRNLMPQSAAEAEDQLSALSVPSPGGFFASLDSAVARNTWSSDDPVPNTSTAVEFYGVPFRSNSLSESLPTSTATSFYNLPWQSRPENPVEHVVSVASPSSTQDPVTARKVVFSPIETITEVDEIDETYGDALKENAAANMDRTQLWLSAQTEYMQAVCEEDDIAQDFEHVEDAVPSVAGSPVEQASSPAATTSLKSKKSVRFGVDKVSEIKDEATAVEKKRISPIHDGTFWEGWQHMKRSQRARDVFQHRQARAEADHIKRVSLQKQHVNQLAGRFEITASALTGAERPVSSLLEAEPQDEKTALIAQANREQQALSQMQSSSWHVQAQREVNGGKLLTSPIVQSFKRRADFRILDLAGQVRCSWAWSVAAEHPNATVYTTVSSDAEAHVAESCYEGPGNHFVVAAPQLWTLPFPDNYFDVVSARNLYTVLRTVWPKGRPADEWDLTLRECRRVLKPGGYLEFDLLDAELAHPDPRAQALGVEFAFNLKTRGYDPTAGKSFLPRLKRAGFRDIKRAWMVLPVADSMPQWSELGGASSCGSSSSSGGSSSGMEDRERMITADGAVVDYQPPVTGSTKDVRAMTGLVGARMWEQWIVKLNGEMGRSEVRCLDEVAKALEEGGKGMAGWRCLVGWARKDTL